MADKNKKLKMMGGKYQPGLLLRFLKEYRDGVSFPTLKKDNERSVCDWTLGLERASEFYKKQLNMKKEMKDE